MLEFEFNHLEGTSFSKKVLLLCYSFNPSNLLLPAPVLVALTDKLHHIGLSEEDKPKLKIFILLA